MTTYVINKKFNTRVQRDSRVLEVAESFGIGLDDKEFVVFDNFEIDIKQGDVVYVTGQSGSGKSQLLKELEPLMKKGGLKTVNLDQLEFDDEKPLISQLGTNTNDAIRLMSIAGLNDAYLWVRRPSELSDGQRYRFKLAKAIESNADVWFADEFLAVLDRVAAMVIAYSLQKAARSQDVTLVVATTHTDMVDDLAPDLMVTKRYREKVRVDAFEEAGKRVAERPITRDELNKILIKAM